MPIEFIKPIRKDTEDRYAVAVPVEDGSVCIIEKCPSKEQLETAYKNWHNLSIQRGITKPPLLSF